MIVESPIPDQRAGDRRKTILDAAAARFQDAGYTRTTVDDIARSSGLSKAAIYHYFSSKEEILFSLHQDFMSWLHERQAARLGEPAAVRLTGTIEDILTVTSERRGHVRVFFENQRDLSDEWRARIKSERVRYAGLVRDVLRDGIADGTLRDGDVHLMALALFGMCNWSYQWLDPEGRNSVAEITSFFNDLFLYGVGVQQAGAMEAR